MGTKKWIWWTVGEALARTSTKVLQKFVGLTNTVIQESVIATIIIGGVQAVIGFGQTRYANQTLFVSRKEIVGACLFGVIGFFIATLGFLVFMYGGDIGVNTFITTLSIIPSGFIDSIVFKHRLGARQWLAVSLAVLAGWAVLGTPSLREIIDFPLWVWLSIINMLGLTVNQWITQSIRNINPFVKNFWGGGSQTLVGLISLMILPVLVHSNSIGNITIKFIAIAILIGVINVAMWIFNVMSYRFGATIALKKLIMSGIHLSTAMIAGVVFFGESLTIYKCIGIALYLMAFLLWDRENWKFAKT